MDADSDGILDSAEGPSGMDVDLDGIDDAYDASVTGAADADGNGIVDDLLAVDADMDGTADADTDADSVPDYQDLDSDNDSLNDIIEAGLPDADRHGTCHGHPSGDLWPGAVGLSGLRCISCAQRHRFDERDARRRRKNNSRGRRSRGDDRRR